MNRRDAQPFLREHHGHAKVTNEELFFDLIYAFAVTQLSHRLLGNLSAIGAIETLLLWFAVWLGWQYTAWVTNWFNPENPTTRIMLFGTMLLVLLMAAAIPQAFGAGALTFAASYAAIQIGRSAYVLVRLPRDSALRPNFRRILGWLCISGALWIAGGLSAGHDTRLVLWAAAVACEYGAPMTGFRLPGLGRSVSSDWTIDGHHLAERCQLFVIVALGESILATGAGFSSAEHPGIATAGALLVAFAGSVALWWIYFDTSSRDGTDAIVESDDPGRIGSYFHYVHVALIAGIIVIAVADELMIHHPAEHVDLAAACVLVGGPLVYLAGNIAYKRIVYRSGPYGGVPLSHLIGIALLLALFPLAFVADRLTVGGATTSILIVVALWQSRYRRQRTAGAHEPAAH